MVKFKAWLRRTFIRSPKQWFFWATGNLLQVPALVLLFVALVDWLPELDFWFKWIVLIGIISLYSFGTDLIQKGRNK